MISSSKIQISEIAEIKSGYSFKSKDFSNEGIGVIKIANIQNKKITRPSNFIKKEINNIDKFKSKKDDLLIALSGATTGKMGVDNLGGFYVNQRIAIIRPKDEKYRKILEYFFMNNNTVDKILNLSIGAAQPNISISSIGKLTINNPNTFNIKKISKSWSIVHKIVSLRNKQLKKINNLDEFLFNNIFDDYFLSEKKSKKYKLISILKNKEDIVAGPFGSNLKVSDYCDTGIPIVRLKNIGKNNFFEDDLKFISASKANELKYHSFKSGDVLLAKLGDEIGKSCIVPQNIKYGIVVSDVVRIRCSSSKLLVNYLIAFLNSQYFKKQIQKKIIGIGRFRVNLNHIRNIELPIPPIDLQKKFIDISKTIINHKKLINKNLKKLNQIDNNFYQQYLL